MLRLNHNEADKMPNSTYRYSAQFCRSAFLISAVMIFPFTSSVFADEAPTGTQSQLRAENLYKENCAICHQTGESEAPREEALLRLTADHILQAMEAGSMTAQAEHLSHAEKKAIAHYLGKLPANIEDDAFTANQCSNTEYSLGSPAVRSWGMGPHNTRHQSASKITATNVGELSLEWVFAFPNAGRARTQPTIAGDTVFTAGQDGKLYALDLDTGCIRWSFQAEAEIRSAIAIGTDVNGTARYLYFGDFDGHIYGFDAAQQSLMWQIEADKHPAATITGSLSLHKGTLYVPVSSLEVISAANPNYECCTFRGSILAVDAITGETQWHTFMTAIPQPTGINSAGAQQFGPSGAPIWSSPTIDEKRNLLYVGTGENYSRPTTQTSDAIVAMSLENGEIIWVNQATPNDAWNGSCGRPNDANCPQDHGPDYDFGAPPILTTLPDGSDVILAGQKSGRVYAMDPDQKGKLLWQRQVGRGGIMGGIHWGMATGGETLFVPVSDLSVYPRDAHKPAQSGLHAVRTDNGEPIWSTVIENKCGGVQWRCSPGLSAAITLGNNLVFGGGLDGVLHAFDTQSGDILWQYDTNVKFKAVNGIEAEGGSIDSDGPVLVGDRLLVTSGYDKWGQKFGNVLLSFKLGAADAEK